MKMQYVINAAVAIASVLLGLALGQRMDDVPPPAVSSAGEEFIMLLYEDETYQAPDPGGMEARIAEYSDWARQVEIAGSCPHLAYGGTVSLRRLARGR